MDAPPLTARATQAAAAAATPSARTAGIGTRLGRSSLIYAASGLATKAVGLLLLPLYTRLLSTDELGAMAVVTGIVAFLDVLFPLALGAAVVRFYHEHRAEPAELRAFVGTVLTLTLGFSLLASGALLLWGPALLQPLLKGIEFWPLMALGLGIAALQPFIDVHLVVLQTAERPAAYGVLALTNLLAKTLLAVALVAGLGLGAEGVLGANLAATALFFAVCTAGARRHAAFGLHWRHARQALAYSLPILPHTLATLARTILDRMFVLHMVSQAAAGLYMIGFQVGTLTQIVCIATSKTLSPIFMRAMHEMDERRLENIRNVGLTLVFVYCWLSALISLFAPEALLLLAGREFHEAWRVVPFLTFTFAASGIYALLVNVLFFHRHLTKYVAVGTLASLGAGALLNLLLIPRFGATGAALAALLAQVGFVVAIGALAHRHSAVRWQYGRFASLFGLALAAALWPLAPWHAVSWGGAALKAALLVALFAVLSVVGWGSPAFLLRELRGLRAAAGAQRDERLG